MTVQHIWYISEFAHFVGGIERNLFSLASALKKEGKKQFLLHADKENESPAFKQAFDHSFEVCEDCNFDDVLKYGEPDVIVIQRPFGRNLLSRLIKIAPVVRVVHDHDLVCPRRHKYFPLSNKICKKPVGHACYLHGCIVGRGEYFGFGFNSVNERLFDIKQHKLLDKIIVNSHYMKEELLINGFDSNKIDVLAPLPAPIEINPKDYPENTKRVLFVGQLIKGKGPDLLLKAMSMLKSEFELVFVGNGNFRQKLVDKIDQCNFREKVTLLDDLSYEEVVEQYSLANVVVVPSRWAEPFGMVGLEAMASARPVVAFRVGGIGDWLWYGVNGLAANEGEVDLLSSHIEWLLGNPALARGLGQSGRKIFQENYKYSDYLLKFITLLSNI